MGPKRKSTKEKNNRSIPYNTELLENWTLGRLREEMINLDIPFRSNSRRPVLIRLLRIAKQRKQNGGRNPTNIDLEVPEVGLPEEVTHNASIDHVIQQDGSAQTSALVDIVSSLTDTVASLQESYSRVESKLDQMSRQRESHSQTSSSLEAPRRPIAPSAAAGSEAQLHQQHTFQMGSEYGNRGQQNVFSPSPATFSANQPQEFTLDSAYRNLDVGMLPVNHSLPTNNVNSYDSPDRCLGARAIRTTYGYAAHSLPLVETVSPAIRQNIISDFDIAVWRSEYDLPEGPLEDKYVDLLLDALGLSNYMDTACIKNNHPFDNAVDNWVNNCPYDVERLPLPSTTVCNIPTYCTGVECCTYVDTLKRNMHYFVSLDTCKYQLTVGIEKLEFSTDLFNYEWGKEQTVGLQGVVKASFVLENLEGEGNILMTLKLSVCFSNTACVETFEILKNARLPKPLCETINGYKDPVFSLTSWLADRGKIVGDVDSLTQSLLMEYVGVAQYLQTNPCTLNDEATHWTSDCPLDVTLLALPSNVGCGLTASCTGVTCCAESANIGRPFSMTLTLDSCNLILKIGIEKMVFDFSLLDYDWGQLKTFDLFGVIRLRYQIEDLTYAQQYLVFAEVAICLEYDGPCEVNQTIFQNTILPKRPCNMDMDFAVNDFSLMDWLATKGYTYQSYLGDDATSELIETLAVTKYLNPQSCQRKTDKYLPSISGWKKVCPLGTQLLSLPTVLSCSLGDSCNVVECCIDVYLIEKSFHISVDIDQCANTLTLQIERLPYVISLIDFNWGEEQTFCLLGFICIRLSVEDMYWTNMYVVDLTLQVCLESGADCLHSIEVMKNTRIPKKICGWSSRQIASGETVDAWLSANNVPVMATLPTYISSQLLNNFGILPYFYSDQCQPWNSGDVCTSDCPLQVNVLQTSSDLTCHVPAICTGVETCVNIPLLGRHVSVYLRLHSCNDTMEIGIDRFTFSVTLYDFEWGTYSTVSLMDIISIEFRVFDLTTRGVYLVDMAIKECFSFTSACTAYELFKQTELPKLPCTLDSGYIDEDFSLALWLQNNSYDLDTIGELGINELYEDLAISAYLQEYSCYLDNLGTTDGWKSECPAEISLTGLPDYVTCSLSNECSRTDCCLSVADLRTTIHYYLDLQPCNRLLVVGIERLDTEFSLDDFDYNQVHSFYLNGVFRLDFYIENYQRGRQYAVSLNISVCYESQDDCLYTVPVFTKTVIPKLQCPWVNGFTDSGFDLDTWVSDNGFSSGDLTDSETGVLFDHLDVSQYLKDTECPFLDSYAADTPINGWIDKCTLGLDLPALPGEMVCVVDTSCTSIQCCLDPPRLQRRLEFSLVIDDCAYRLTTSIENLVLTRSLSGFQFDTDVVFDLDGLLVLTFKIVYVESSTSTTLSQLDVSMRYVIDLKVDLFFSAGTTPYRSYVLANRLVTNKLPCDHDEMFLVTDFSLEAYRQENGLESSILSQYNTVKLLEYIKIAEYMLASPCEVNTAEDWTSDCPMETTLPDLADDLSCKVTSLCTGVECCMRSTEISQTFHSSVSIDLCALEMKVALERVTFTVYLTSYQWGKKETFYLFGVERIEFTVEQVLPDRLLKVNLNMSLCFETSLDCERSERVLQETILPVLPCDWTSDFIDPDFSFATWAAKHDYDITPVLPEKVVAHLMSEVGVDSYLQTPTCTKYTIPVDSPKGGWKIDCPQAVSSFVDLPDGATCQLGSNCNQVDCCVEVLRLNRTFHFILQLDPCSQILTIGIENIVRKVSLTDYTWGTEDKFYIYGAMKMNFNIENIRLKKMYMVSARLSVCIDPADCPLSVNILQNAVLPQQICSWDQGFATPGFDLPSWLSSKSLATTTDLDYVTRLQLQDDLALTPYLLYPSCEIADRSTYIDGWINECSGVTSGLPTLPADMSCSISSDCSAVSCCVTSEILGKNVQFSLTIDSCSLLTVTIESFSRIKNLLEIDFSQPVTFALYGVLEMEFQLNPLVTYNAYEVSLLIKECYGTSTPCEKTVNVLTSTFIPEEACPLNKDFATPGFSTQSWLDENNYGSSTLSDVKKELLYWDMEITRYMKDTRCTVGNPVYNGVIYGWSSECHTPMVTTLQNMTEEADVSCHLGASCLDVTCCIDVQQIQTNFEFSFNLKPCELVLEIAIENMECAVPLSSLRRGDTSVINLNGLLRLSFRLSSTNAIQLQLDVCMSSTDCSSYVIIQNIVFDIPTCTFDAQFHNPTFSLSSWLSERSLTTSDELTRMVKNDLILALGLQHFLLGTMCGLDTALITGGVKMDVTGLAEDAASCWQSSDKTVYSCCVYSSSLQRHLYLTLNLDLCNYQMTIQVEDIHVQYSLLNYEWGTQHEVTTKGVWRFKFAVNNVQSEMKFTIDLSAKVCVESSGACDFTLTVANNLDIPYLDCVPVTSDINQPFHDISYDFWKLSQCTFEAIVPTPGCVPIPNNTVEDNCQYSQDCSEIICCIDFYFGEETRNLFMRFEANSTTSQFTYELERKQWTTTLTTDEFAVSKTVADAITFNVMVDDFSATAYKLTVNMTLCIGTNADPNCYDFIFFQHQDLNKQQPPSKRRRRRRNAEEGDYDTALRALLETNPSNEEMEQFFADWKEQEELKRSQNREAEPISDSDTSSSYSSVYKAMGENNPDILRYKKPSNSPVVVVEGGDEILSMLGGANDIAERASELFIAGEGLSEAGTELLGAQLANMTIGDIEAMLHANKVDPFLIRQLFLDFIELARALFSEVMKSMTGGNAEEAFKSFELTLQGTFTYPRKEVLFFEYSQDFPVGGFIIIQFTFGASGYYGLELGWQAKILSMKAGANVVPYGGLTCYGEVGVGYVLYGKLRLEGDIMELRFPTKAEIVFNKFPLDVAIIMDLELIPVRLRLYGLVTVEVSVFGATFKKTLFKKKIWEYEAAMITKRMIEVSTKDEDASPPEFGPPVEVPQSRRKRAASSDCEVKQLINRDFTSPAFEITVAAHDDKADVTFYLDVGTFQGGNDVINNEQLGGPSTVLTTPMKTGVPLFFTVYGENSAGARSSVECYLPVYDVTVPTGRLSVDFVSTSNPNVIKANALVHDESEIQAAHVGVGFGKSYYGDQMLPWTTTDLRSEEPDIDISNDPHNILVMEHFTEYKEGKLKKLPIRSTPNVHSVGVCAKTCAVTEGCASFNYDFGTKMTCELLPSIQGYGEELSISGLYGHYERIGSGSNVEFVYNSFNMDHNMLHYVNLDLTNVLGYVNIISSTGVLTDLTCPEPGPLMNVVKDDLEKVECESMVPENRYDLLRYCTGTNHGVSNHRTIIDGEGSQTIFNGDEPMTDLGFTRSNNFLAANWDGIYDNQTGILTYSLSFGRTVCEDLIHSHNDPHSHLLHESHWTNLGVITATADYNPFPLESGAYYTTIRALNKVDFGGPFSTTICHSRPIIIDITKPFVYEVYNIKYNEETYAISMTQNTSDPESGVLNTDICLGRTIRDCNLLTWQLYPYAENLTHVFRVPDGVPAWIRLRAVNNVELFAVGRANQAIIVDVTPPEPGTVFDGPIYSQDLMFTKDDNILCSTWSGFYDPHSGIGSYAVGIGSEPGLTDVAALEKVNYREYSHCITFNASNSLIHNAVYYTVVWANNGGINQRNVSVISDGVRVDLTPPVVGSLIDGNLPAFEDLKYSSSKSTVKLQWKDYHDPESDIRDYEASVLRKRSDGTWETIQNATKVDKTEATTQWKTLHLIHKDEIKSSLKTTNRALNDIDSETNGFIVDLTPPLIRFIGDGENIGENKDFQSDATSLSVNFDFSDPESHLSSLQLQIHEARHGSKQQIYPVSAGTWVDLADAALTTYTQGGLSLSLGHRYSVRVAAVNGAGLLSAYETDGVILDMTPPVITWLHVGVLSDEEEILVDGYAWQSDHEGIKSSWIASDPESGITGISYTVGTSLGGNEVLDWTVVDGASLEAYLQVALTNTDLDIYTPVYYVSLKVRNGAGLWSEPKSSAPIVVVPEDKAGIVTDGAITGFENDLDYQSDTHTATITFAGFESALHGIVSFDWTIGTTPGGEDVRPYMEHGIIHEDTPDLLGGGLASAGLSQTALQLEQSKKYYTTLRAITNAGNVLQATTDGFTVDITAPLLEIESLSKASPLASHDTIFQLDESTLSALWNYSEPELNDPDLHDNIAHNWYTVGTSPWSNDLYQARYLDVSENGERALEVGAVVPAKDGLPTILSVYVKNTAGIVGSVRGPAVIHDNSPPLPGTIICSSYVQSHAEVNCEWNGFYDLESRIEKYLVAIGTEKGFNDKLLAQEIPGTQLHFSTSEAEMSHNDVMYVTVTAVNSVGLNISAFSESVVVDDTPPTSGVVVELFSFARIDPFNSTATVDMNRKACESEAECRALDSTCIETFTRLGVAWSQFTDDESDIDRFEIGLGTTPGGYQIVPFITIDKTNNFYVLDDIDLMNQRQVFVTVKAINGAGLGTSSVSDGVYLSYLSQGLPPLSPIGIWDHHPSSFGDIQYQTEETTIEAMWDVTGDPCPVVKYEWAVEQTDGTLIQDFLEIGSTHGYNGEVDLEEGTRYYSLLRVTNAIGYTYTLRSDGVTVNSFPLIPGYIYDGDVEGYDLLVIPSRSQISANWDGFGEIKEKVDIQDVLTGNKGVEQVKDPDASQEISYYLVGVGTDRRFTETRENIVPFTNVGTNTSVTFTDLDLEPGNAVYYFTVQAFSTSLATATVTSNGFSVTFSGGVTAGTIEMADWIYTTTYIEVQWTGFTSQLDIILYYIALSDNTLAKDELCKHYVDGGKASASNHSTMFNLVPVTNVGTVTYKNLSELALVQNGQYYVWVMAIDQSGECNMTYRGVQVDVTPPVAGLITSGPFYDMTLAYSLSSTKLSVKWKDFSDGDSSISHYNLSLWNLGPCSTSPTSNTLMSSLNIDDDYSDYIFTDINLLDGYMYKVTLEAFNNATLSVMRETSPTVFDDSVPQAGFVAEGSDFLTDVVYWGSDTFITGTLLHHPDPGEDPCPNRTISMNDTNWNSMELGEVQDPTGVAWNLVYRSANVLYNNYTDTVTVKMARDSKADVVYSGAYVRPAEVFKGGMYEISIKAANGGGNAVTGVTFWDGQSDDLHIYNHVEEDDWTAGQCACCYETPIPADCPCDCAVVKENDNGVPQTTPEPTTASVTQSSIISQQSCGFQLFAGANPTAVTWCRFYNNTAPTMTVTSTLDTDPSLQFHTYRIEFKVIKEEILETWCFYVFMDGLQISDLCGIPKLSESSFLVLHGWNKNNYLAELTAFDLWEARAEFRHIVFPPRSDSLCRFGSPFIGGMNAIVSYEAGIGSTKGTTDIVPLTEVLVPCIPCSDSCSHIVCDDTCTRAGNHLLEFALNDIVLESNISMYLIVKAILGSGASVQQSSNGFYIDLTPPVFDPDVMLYIDVRQGEFTPVEYQGSETTIKAIWLCTDDESGIMEYTWSIGTRVGLSDIQPEVSTGTNATGINTTFEGVLKNNQTYYATVTCTNGAGLKTVYEDTKGVTVLLESPDPDKVVAAAVNAETFDVPVSPATALKSEDPNSCGQAFEVSEDPSVQKYVFCVGSSEVKGDTDEVIDDIIPCVWVSVDKPGVVEIKDGYLQLDGVKYYTLSELKVLSSGVYDSNTNTSAGPNNFHMAMGQTLFLYLKMCNLAERCAVKLVNTLIITNENTKLGSSSNGEPISASLTATGTRKKRATDILTIETPPALVQGQTLAMNILTDVELNQTYTSDASADFVSYIANPNLTLAQVDRILYGRIQTVSTYFAVSPVGQQALPGPLSVTFSQTRFNPAPNEETVMLIHWNPDYSVWQLTSETCKEENTTVYDNQTNSTSTVLVCNTRLAASVETTNNTNLTAYFYKETHFGVATVLGGVVNNAPNLTGPLHINITEDSVGSSAQLTATDAEDDEVLFSLVSGDNSAIGTVTVNSSGVITIDPCPHCYGSVEIEVRVTDQPTEAEIPASSSTGPVQITVLSINDPPVISLFDADNRYILLPDPTEPVVIYRNNDNGTSHYFDFGMLVVYDVDRDSLIINTTELNVNGTFTFTEVTVEDMQNTIACANSMCLNQSVPTDLNTMGWQGLRITYNTTADFYGEETIKLVAMDTSGTYSDVVTLTVVLAINKCENDGVCLSLDPTSYGCDDLRRTTDFDLYYTCTCPKEWTGPYCESDVNECSLYSPCGALEECTNSIGGYDCTTTLTGWKLALVIVGSILFVAGLVLSGIFGYRHYMKVKRRNMYPRERSNISTSSSSSLFALNTNKVHPANQLTVYDEDAIETGPDARGPSPGIDDSDLAVFVREGDLAKSDMPLQLRYATDGAARPRFHHILPPKIAPPPVFKTFHK